MNWEEKWYQLFVGWFVSKIQIIWIVSQKKVQTLPPLSPSHKYFSFHFLLITRLIFFKGFGGSKSEWSIGLLINWTSVLLNMNVTWIIFPKILLQIFLSFLFLLHFQVFDFLITSRWFTQDFVRSMFESLDVAACEQHGDGQQMQMLQCWQDGILCTLEYQMDWVTVWLVHRRYCILKSVLMRFLPWEQSNVGVVAASTKPLPRRKLTLIAPTGIGNRQSWGSKNYYMPSGRKRVIHDSCYPIQCLVDKK